MFKKKKQETETQSPSKLESAKTVLEFIVTVVGAAGSIVAAISGLKGGDAD